MVRGWRLLMMVRAPPPWELKVVDDNIFDVQWIYRDSLIELRAGGAGSVLPQRANPRLGKDAVEELLL
jgi:hypothetical protein